VYRTIKLRKKALLWIAAAAAAAAALLFLPGTGAVFPVSSAGQPPAGQPIEPQKVVYLTYDDGPSKNTSEILDVLKEEGVEATFFVIGATTDRGKALYQRILDEGHAMGLHTFTHEYGEIYASADAYLDDLARLSAHLRETVGYQPDIFRFPGGSNNATASPAVLKEIKERTTKMGLCWFDWNTLGKDDHSWTSDAADICQNVIAAAGDKDRIVVLMHDDALRTTAAAATRQIIAHYRQKGYEFRKLSKDVEPVRFS
jgi:peptidoglycan/xylan/chitin deacetylase (PgdA/CDA1 family)